MVSFNSLCLADNRSSMGISCVLSMSLFFGVKTSSVYILCGSSIHPFPQKFLLMKSLCGLVNILLVDGNNIFDEML